MLEHAEISEEPGEEGLQILPFHVTEIGAYKLERVVDETRSDVRLYRSEAIVAECPTAEISSFSEVGQHFCQGEIDALKIHVRGVPPLHVTYSQNVNGHSVTIPIDSISPESFVSPLLHGEMSLHLVKHDDYTFAQAHGITLTYPLTLDTVGVWSYVLTDVSDALGNKVEFEDSPPGYSVIVHETPKVSMRGCSEDSPMKVLKGRDTNLYFNIQTTEAGPFNITLGYTPPESREPTSIETHKLSHKRDSLSVTEPGVYSIINITTRHCPGEVLAPQSCLVITPPEPSLQIEWSTLKDHCSGTVGVTADLTFIGEPPFHLSYRTLSKSTNQHEVKRIKVDRTRHQMEFKPEVAGTYQYEFIALDDINYRWIELDGEMYTHEATIHPLPGVKFVDVNLRKTCIGSSMNVPVRMIGSGPWNLTYDIVESGGRRDSFTTRVEDSETVLELPEFQKGGRGTVSLRSVVDGSGCKVQLGEEDLVIDVRREKPSAKFYTNSITGRDGDIVKLPLRLTGDGPWYVKYSVTNSRGQSSEHEIVLSDPNGYIETRSDGVFELISIADSSCPGIVKPGQERLEVTWIARPKFEIIGFESAPHHEIQRMGDVCAGQDAFLDLIFHGTPKTSLTNLGVKPFTVEYNVLKLDAKDHVVSRTKEEISAAMTTAQIRLRTNEPGKYRYEFTHLSDAVYDDPKNLGSPFVIEQEVQPLPTAKFVDSGEPYLYCADTSFDNPKKNGIPILISGSLPVTIQLELRNDLQRDVEFIELKDISEERYFFVPPPHSLTHGLHILTIVEVKDSKECISQPSENNRARFIVADEASISPLEPQEHHCVGDRISYALQGTSPWQIEYEFDGKRNLAKTSSPTFSRIAEKRGNLTIISVADRASTCKTFISPGKMEKHIHDVPSVRINGGTHIVENIREGPSTFCLELTVGDQAEITFELFGVPPFSMTLRVSSIQGKNRKAKLLQMHTINNVLGHSHSFFTSQEGVYEVTQLQDRYCRYPREDTGSSKLLEY